MSNSIKDIPLFNLQAQLSPLKDEILTSWSKILDQNQLTYGEETEKFETDFAQLSGTQYAIAVRSGTASLCIALKALDIGPGDEVITTPVTFSATADAISLVGAKPVFVDVESTYGTIDPREVEKRITTKTKAVLAVHLYGVPCLLEELVTICKKNNLHLIEDASHAHGSIYKGKPVGSFGSVGCFSLYPSKTLGCAGNAGVITVQDAKIATRCRSFAHHGIKEGFSKYEHFEVGYNELIDNIQSAVLNIKMKCLPDWMNTKRRIAELYNKACLKTGQLLMSWPTDCNPSLYVYALQVVERKKFQAHMSLLGIETGIYYPTPLHLQPSYKFLGYETGDFPVAESWMNHTVSLPLYPELSEQEIERVCDALSLFNLTFA